MVKTRMPLSAFWFAVSLAGGTIGCRTWVAQPPTPDRILAAGQHGPVTVTKIDNSVVMVNNPDVAHDTLFGTTADNAADHVAIPLAQIRTVGTNEVSTARSAELGAGVIVGLLAIAGLIVGIALLGSHGRY